MQSGGGNLRLLLHATVTHLNTDSDGSRIGSLEIACTPEKRATVKARAFVLCAGGVENARILLYSNRVTPAGIGNDHDLVGRYFMDHPRDMQFAVRFHPTDAARVFAMFGPQRIITVSGYSDLLYGMALSPDRQHRDGLVNCAALPDSLPKLHDPVSAAQRLVRGRSSNRVRDTLYAISGPGAIKRAVEARRAGQEIRRASALDRIGFVILSEQVPDRDSRVSLTDRRDRLGLPISQTDWRIGALEVASQVALANTMQAEFRRLGLPPVHLAEWVRDHPGTEPRLVDGCHPMGTTRMADDPRAGVVDADCRVHGVDGLYVAGSSVFPTAGHANPTVTLVALAIRLADHLKAQLCSTVTPAPTISARVPAPDLSGSPLSPGTTCAVTGATGFIGGRLTEQLVAQGVKVVCLTRPGSDRALPEGAEVRALDLADPPATRAALDDVQFIFHCAYDWGDEEWNVRALYSLIDACGHSGCRRFVYLSSFVVYDMSSDGTVGEDAPRQIAGPGYAGTKRALEDEVLRAAREDGFPGVVLQPTIVYGPGSRRSTEDPADMLRYGTVVLPAGGQGACNAVYVDDVVSSMILAATRPEAEGQAFLISGPPVTWSEFYEQIARAVRADGPRYLPVRTIMAQTSKVGKIRQLVSTPQLLVRRLLQTGLGRKILRRLPSPPRRSLERVARRPGAQIRGKIHVPDLVSVQSRTSISWDKAHFLLGYEPRYDFAAGMVPTRLYLERYIRLNPMG
jgi:nucleoside-diphosphate-sugar epimerase